jgi:hypothetical protein
MGEPVYHMEPMRNLATSEIILEMHYIVEHLEIWDYSTANLNVWSEFGVTRVKAVKCT